MAKKKAHPIYTELGTMMRLQPFQPFDSKTAAGDTIHVFHRDFVARSPTGESAIVYDKDGHFRIIHLNMVVTLEPSRPKGTPRPGRR
ncbi:MAG TPA: hypothetical protein VGR35_10125 [Tepidisphaeraceae bacterium]|nr:hypothetical protein [Tepidisphaeraceae bacterium]